MLQILVLILIVYLASGAWCCISRRRRLPTEREYQRAERWRAEHEGKAPDDDPLLQALDRALLDGEEGLLQADSKKRLSPEGEKA